MASRVANVAPIGTAFFRPAKAHSARHDRPRRGLKRAGRKTKEWDSIRAILNKRFLAAGITSCEVGRPGCWGTEALSHAHMDKRRFLTSEELWITILACSTVCHPWLESLPRAEMKSEVQRIIAERQNPV